MRIGIDIRVLAGRRTGIGRFVGQLLGGLAAVDRENTYILFFNAMKGPTPDDLPQAENFETVSIRVPNKILNAAWAYTPVPKIESFAGLLDVFHGPNFQMPPTRRAASVLTIHDLVFLVHPEMAIPSSVRHFGPRIRHYAGRADIIAADSNATARDIVEQLGTPSEKVQTVYPGATCIPKSTEEQINIVRQRYNIGELYILFVGAIEPRKNLSRLMKAFEVSGLHRDFQLVLAGPEGWHMEQFHGTLNALACKDRVRWLRYVSDRDLAALYSGATFFAYPSLLEGFGLPILEAMSVRCPVMTSNVSSMPEVAGEAAVYVEPLAIDSIADGMKRLAGDSELRKWLAELGRQRTALFTWERTAREMIAIYRRAANSDLGNRL
jgi:glycosyltransferase involved in cell wall biosynthesis